MASTTLASARGARRVLQACENCRRKKTRCPGERPRCSNCSRLRQHCQYPSTELQSNGESAAQSSIRTLEDRLSQLEDKLDLILERPGAAPTQAETPQTTGTNLPDGASTVSPICQGSHTSQSSLLPSREIISKAIEIYFLCSHRQPIWLFDPPIKLSPDCSEELLLCILGLSIQYAPETFAEFQLQTSSAFNDAARSLIMLKIANSTVDLSALQSLCLLAYSNLVCGDVQLGSFHITLVGNLLQFAGLDSHISQDRTPFLEEQRRLFWSIQTIKVLCGLPTKIPSTLDMKAPRFLVPEDTPRRISGQAPLLPLEVQSNRGERSLGIWAHMVRSASLWGLVRAYVWRCAMGQAKAPWQPDSDYTAINSQLLDMECAFPTSYRYDCANFMERAPEALHKHRDFWLPWMKIQITYHTIHSVLNHPFLYSPRVSKPKPGPNAFWKTSTDLALLHSTWIARLIGMAMKKGLLLSDPFFSYAAAVAVTLHLYWSRTADLKIKTPAEKNLEICRSFIGELGTHWQICRTMVSLPMSPNRTIASYKIKQAADIDNLIQISSQESQPHEVPSTMISDHISLMWKILDFASMQRSHCPLGQSLFQESWEADMQSRASSHEQMALEDPEMDSPPGDFQTSVGSYAAAPDWFSPPIVNTSPQQTIQRDQLRPEDDPEGVSAAATAHGEAQQSLAGLSNWIWDPIDTNMIYDPFTQYFNRSAPDSRWWDGGNL